MCLSQKLVLGSPYHLVGNVFLDSLLSVVRDPYYWNTGNNFQGKIAVVFCCCFGQFWKHEKHIFQGYLEHSFWGEILAVFKRNHCYVVCFMAELDCCTVPEFYCLLRKNFKFLLKASFHQISCVIFYHSLIFMWIFRC